MSYFLLSHSNSCLNTEKIKIKTKLSSNEKMQNQISKSLAIYLEVLKKQIDKYSINWDIYKKYTNQYEYIHTVIPQTKQSVSKLKPLSRSFYKLIEIYGLLYLNDEFTESIKTFHFAEGPGGFIEAIDYIRCNNNDTYHGMTLVDDSNHNIPGWKKSKFILSKLENVNLEKGISDNGNLFDINNLWDIYERYNGSINLVTADGGFDFSIDFNKQEILSTKLIFCELCFAVAVQKKGGSFILKIFDIFLQSTIDILHILSHLYERVYICKPHTSRPANSEKYVVCKGFKIDNTRELLNKFSEIYKYINDDYIIDRFLSINIPYYFINKIEDINAILGQQQIENIVSTLYLLDNNKHDSIETLKKNNTQKCINWCAKYKIQYNKSIPQTNVFLYN